MDRRFTKDGEKEGEEEEEKRREEKLSVPYKLINLGANNCLAWFRESQIGGVDLAVFRGHAFSATIRQCVCPIGEQAFIPGGRIVSLDVGTGLYICKLLVTNYYVGMIPLSSLLERGRRRERERDRLPLSRLLFLLAQFLKLRGESAGCELHCV